MNHHLTHHNCLYPLFYFLNKSVQSRTQEKKELIHQLNCQSYPKAKKTYCKDLGELQVIVLYQLQSMLSCSPFFVLPCPKAIFWAYYKIGLGLLKEL